MLESVEHSLQLFDDSDSLADAVAAFIKDGLLSDETSLLAVTDAHWSAIDRRLRDMAVDTDDAANSGAIIVRDAARTLRLFERYGRLDQTLFDASIGADVRELISEGRRLRVYGEMVDLLAVQGNFEGAKELERFWNDLRARTPFTLFCGYSSENFGNPRTAASLRSICRLHSRSTSNPGDLLASFLLRTHVEA